MRYRTKFILFLWAAIIVVAPPARAQMESQLVIYNSFYDLCQGDTWEYIADSQIRSDLKSFPNQSQIIGFGTTDRSYRNGAVIVSGSVREPHIFWCNPEYPHQVEAIYNVQFPWLALAVCHPQHSFKKKMTGVTNIHRFVVDQLENAGFFKIAALKIQGKFEEVSYYIPYHFPKSGLLSSTKPNCQPGYQREFTVKTPQQWEIFGLYFKETEGQLTASRRGYPLLLYGWQKEKQRGGIIKHAKAQEAEVFIYPLKKLQLLQSDLTVASLSENEGKIKIRVRNQGRLNVKHILIQVSFPQQESHQEQVLSLIERGSEEAITINAPAGYKGEILVTVDPKDEIKESREDNNQFHHLARE